MKRSKPDNRNHLSVDANQVQEIVTQEDYATYPFSLTTGALEKDPILPGVKHRFTLLPGARAHYVWLAAGAYLQLDPDDEWAIQGCLNFRRGGRDVGQFLFGDASKNIFYVAAAVKRRPIRIRADGFGSTQPVLRFQQQYGSASVARDNLDMPAFYIPVSADFMEYELESSAIRIQTGVVQILTGLRIVSLL